jgi:hypothetical protein
LNGTENNTGCHTLPCDNQWCSVSAQQEEKEIIGHAEKGQKHCPFSVSRTDRSENKDG